MKGLKSLDLSSIGAGKTEPDTSQPPPAPRAPGQVFSAKDLKPSPEAQAVAQASSFPSREHMPPPEPVRRTQINSYLTAEAGAEFKALCKRERYSYGEMIEILMKFYIDHNR